MHWDYHSHGGPEGWPHLPEPASETPAFPDCALDRQSPVDIPRRAPLSAGLLLDYQPSRLAVTNNGHTIQVPYEAGSAMTAAGKTYRLLQFHFHAPSEHLIHGRPAAMEAHFVHQAAGGELAVLGVLIVEGGPHQALQYILDVMPADQATVGASREIDAGAFMPDDLSYYAYEGSLTTPPCTEGVMWHVLRKPITASPQQVEAFRSLPFLSPEGDFVGNARPVQPLNGRPGEQAAPPLTEGPISPPATGSAGLASR